MNIARLHRAEQSMGHTVHAGSRRAAQALENPGERPATAPLNNHKLNR